MRTALHMWFSLDRPQYDQDALDLFGKSDAVYYARQRSDVAREIIASRDPHKASRLERDGYRSRLRDRAALKENLHGRWRVTRANSICYSKHSPNPPGAAPYVRRLGRQAPSRWFVSRRAQRRVWRLYETGSALGQTGKESRGCFKGFALSRVAQLFKSPEKGKQDPNRYMRTVMYYGITPGVSMYRCGTNPEVGCDLINKPAVLGGQKCLSAVAHRPWRMRRYDSC